MTATEAPVLELRHVDPSTLVDHPSNVRKNVGDLTDLTTSITEVGVMVPLVVQDVDGTLQILAGHRRKAAAVKAKATTVPVVVIPAGTDAAQIESMLTENLQRADLTAGEEAQAFEQLAALGVDVGRIAKVSGRKKADVETHLRVAKSRKAVGVATRYDLTLEQMSVLAEFEDDAGAIKDLTVVAQKDPGQFLHKASQIRQDREKAAKIGELKAKMKADGVKVFDGRIGYNPSGDEPCELSDLASSVKNERLSKHVAEHKDCPGHAGRILSNWDGTRIEYVCTAPKTNGHKKFRQIYDKGGSQQEQTPEAAAKATQERREQLEANRQWKAATPVRQQFVVDLLRRKTMPKGTLAYVADFIAGHAHTLLDHQDDGMLTSLLTGKLDEKTRSDWRYNGKDAVEKAIAKMPEARKPMGLLAIVCAHMERRLHEQGHKSADASKAGYYAFLESAGYTMAPVEWLCDSKRHAKGAKAMTQAVLDKLAAKAPAKKRPAKKAPAAANKARGPKAPAKRPTKKAVA